jgi:putative PIN family toxin of toxin-antitoxin system
MARVVLDTNVLVSALMSRASPPGVLLERWASKGAFELLVSPELLAELSRVVRYPSVRRGIRMDDALLEQRIAMIEALATHVELGKVGVGNVRDPDDEVVLAVAVEGRADVIVTGDDDLLSLISFKGIGILRPREYLDLLDARSPEGGSVRERGATYRAGARRPRRGVSPVAGILDAMAQRMERLGLSMTDDEAMALALEAQRWARARARRARDTARAAAR